jgi:hypothetical protein
MSEQRPPGSEQGSPENESDALSELGKRLRHERPVPSAAFRSQVRTWLMIEGASRPGARSQGIWLRVAICAISGSGLLLVVGIGTAGLGPFAS